MLLDDDGDEGDDPLPHAESSVAIVMPDVTVHASVQKRRRVMRVSSSVIRTDPRRASACPWISSGKMEAAQKTASFRGESGRAITGLKS